MPAISVLIPARNAACTLDQALGSIKAQSHPDWEAIVVDDASTDDTPRLLAAWARRDERFRIVTNPEPRGLVDSLNRALGQARAPVLARMDADDVSLPRRLELQLELLEARDLAAVGCRVRYFPAECVAGGAARYEQWLNEVVTPEEHARDLFVECPLAHPTMMLRREALERIGGYRAHGWPEDYDLCFRLWLAGYRMAKVPELLFLWREGAERTSRVHPDYSPAAFLRCKAFYLRRSYFAGERVAVIFGAGPVGKSIARALDAEGVRVKAFVDLDPRKIGQSVYGVPVLDQDAGLRLRGEAFGLAAVGQPGVRDEIRLTLNGAGWVEGEDYCCVA